jgi:predicted nucleic acid-binding Zn ribbon protein
MAPMTKIISRPHRIGDVLGAVLDRLAVRDRLREYAVWPLWDEVVGATVALHARPTRIRRGLLFISVDSSVWMQELQFLKETIRERLNGQLGGDVVKDLFFVLGGTERDDRK